MKLHSILGQVWVIKKGLAAEIALLCIEVVRVSITISFYSSQSKSYNECHSSHKPNVKLTRMSMWIENSSHVYTHFFFYLIFYHIYTYILTSFGLYLILFSMYQSDLKKILQTAIVYLAIGANHMWGRRKSWWNTYMHKSII